MQKRILLALLSLIVLFPFNADAAEILVNPGEDLQLAIRRAREMRRLHQVGPDDTLFVTLADGIYPLAEPLFIRPEDSGTAAGPTVFRAATPGKAIIEGGMVLSDWRRPTREELQGIPERYHDRIWVCPAPVVNGRRVEVHQLFSGSRRLPEAGLVSANQMLPLSAFRPETREIWVEAGLLPAAYLKHYAGSSMRVHQRWAIAYLRISDVRIEDGMAKFRFFNTESRREFEHPWPQPVINEDLGNGEVVSSSFNLLGSPVFLDQQGEWMQRSFDGLVFYLTPTRDCGIPEESVYMPVTDQLVWVDGSLERPVHDIVFDGLTFRHSRWNQPNEEGLVTLQAGFPIIDAYKLQEPGLPEKASLENQAWIGRPLSAVSLKGVQRVHFQSCSFEQIGATALDYTEASSDCYVRDNRFSDIGGTAILVGHFPAGGFETHVPFRPQVQADLCHDFLIQSNVVQNVGTDDWGACAINAGYVYNTTIRDNTVDGCPWSGICLGWGWTRLQSGMQNNHLLYNSVTHFGMQLHDCGALYTLSNQPGSSIVGNCLGQMGEAPYATNHRAFYIYLDEATDGFTIRNNQMPAPLIGTNQPGKHLISDIPLP
ncbi:MAG: right-handed parallel beta-helix repeat-containing protein [Bacteroidales bacterium]|nr:right-handed parallel beta-helix repeat-containing protein [Bacteroidales bacterium]